MDKITVFFILGVISLSVSANKIIASGEGSKLKHEKGASVEILHQANDSLNANIFMAKLTVPAGGKVPEHRDSSAEYLYFISGSGVITIEGKTHEVNAGDTVFMEKDALVSFQAGDQQVIVFQVFAPAGPETKYDTWANVE